MKRASLAITLGLLAITIAIGLATIGMRADDDAEFHFIPNSLVVSRSVYVGWQTPSRSAKPCPRAASRVPSRCRSLQEERRM